MFLTKHKRRILTVILSGDQDLPTIAVRSGVISHLVTYQDLRDLRSHQMVRTVAGRNGELWELTARGRRQLLHDAQLEMKGIHV